MAETYLDEFKREMAEAEKIYSKEIQEFAKKYDFLGEMIIIEEPDITTQEYVYTFENLNGTSADTLRETRKELKRHMKEFSKENDIYEFYKNARITFNRWF